MLEVYSNQVAESIFFEDPSNANTADNVQDAIINAFNFSIKRVRAFKRYRIPIDQEMSLFSDFIVDVDGEIIVDGDLVIG